MGAVRNGRMVVYMNDAVYSIDAAENGGSRRADAKW